MVRARMRRPSTVRGVLACGLVLAAAGLAGCGGGGAGTPATTGQASPAASATHRPGEQLTLRFRARATGNAAGQKPAFFGEYKRVRGDPAGASATIPPPGPGTGYVSVRLTDGDEDGVYTASQHLDPGRYVVAIFAGHGVRHAGAGTYPAPPVTRISQASHGAGVTVELTRDRTVTGVYRAGAGTPSSAAPKPSTGAGQRHG
jgi:hypothetical protein